MQVKKKVHILGFGFNQVNIILKISQQQNISNLQIQSSRDQISPIQMNKIVFYVAGGSIHVTF